MYTKFPAGEVNVKVSFEDLGVIYKPPLKSSDDLIALLLRHDAYKRLHGEPAELVIGYMPYGRQDRVCNKGEAFSLKVVCDMINSSGFKSVTVEDPHSDVTPALLDNCKVIPQHDLFCSEWKKMKLMGYREAVLVSPDAGANKKISEVCTVVGKDVFIRADKKRDLRSGAIIETVVFAPEKEVQGKRFLIVDDICDGGRTFLEVGKVLKQKGAEKVGLYTTHGIYSKGKQVFEGIIDDLFCVNDFTK